MQRSIQKQQLNNDIISPLLDRQIDEITKGIPKNFNKSLRTLSVDNIKTIIRYIVATNTEIRLSTSYRKDIIQLLTKFARFHANSVAKHDFNFKEVVRNDVINFLDSLRKTNEEDPLHKWIGTYNIYRIHLLRFFKWLHAPDIEPSKRPKPAVMDNIPKLKRKEKSIYTASDMWTSEDDLLFLKYCPNIRDHCYHAMSKDLGARPHEILNLKRKHVTFKTTVNNHVYAEVNIVTGKTGQRSLPLINSIPYLKDYLNHNHPMPNNPTAPLICGTGKSFGQLG